MHVKLYIYKILWKFRKSKGQFVPSIGTVGTICILRSKSKSEVFCICNLVQVAKQFCQQVKQFQDWLWSSRFIRMVCKCKVCPSSSGNVWQYETQNFMFIYFISNILLKKLRLSKKVFQKQEGYLLSSSSFLCQNII